MTWARPAPATVHVSSRAADDERALVESQPGQAAVGIHDPPPGGRAPRVEVGEHGDPGHEPQPLRGSIARPQSLAERHRPGARTRDACSGGVCPQDGGPGGRPAQDGGQQVRVAPREVDHVGRLEARHVRGVRRRATVQDARDLPRRWRCRLAPRPPRTPAVHGRRPGPASGARRRSAPAPPGAGPRRRLRHEPSPRPRPGRPSPARRPRRTPHRRAGRPARSAGISPRVVRRTVVRRQSSAGSGSPGAGFGVTSMIAGFSFGRPRRTRARRSGPATNGAT